MCAVAAVATVALWMFSSDRLWIVGYGTCYISHDRTWGPGRLVLSYVPMNPPGLIFESSHYVPLDRIWLMPEHRRFPPLPVVPAKAHTVMIPFWIPLAASLLGFILLRPKRRLPLGCRECDYDLTGNVSGTCPECGTPIPVASES